MLKLILRSRALMLGLFLAALGFSYALATSGGAQARIVVIPGNVGIDNGSLRFTNLFLDNPAAIPGPTRNSLHVDAANYPDGGDTPVDPRGHDLGDATYDEELTRFLRAAGGLPPYFFTGGPAADPQNSPDKSTLRLSNSGRIAGTVDDFVVSPLIFDATVTDSRGTQVDANFYLFLQQPNRFQPVNDFFEYSNFGDTAPVGLDLGGIPCVSLLNGDVGMPYLDKVEIMNGESTAEGWPLFTDAQKPNGGDVTVLLNDGNHPLSGRAGPSAPTPAGPVRLLDTAFAPVASFLTLEEVGLSMAVDGTVFGVPFFSGFIEFDALAFDGHVFPPVGDLLTGTGCHAKERVVRIAVDRNDLFSQGDPATVPFNVGQINNDLVIQNLVLRTGDSVTDQEDSLIVTGKFNPNGQFGASERKQQNFSIAFGQMHFSAPMDDKNTVKDHVFKDGTRLSASFVSRTGTFVIQISKGHFRWPLGALFGAPNAPVKRLPVYIGIENVIQSAEALTVVNKRKGLRSTLTYKYGKNLRNGVDLANLSLGGVFQVYNARGKNGEDFGVPGDAWTTRFLISPRCTRDDPTFVTNAQAWPGIQVPDGTDLAPGLTNLKSITVRIGTWSGSYTLSNLFLQPEAGLKVKASANGTVVTFPQYKAALRKFVISASHQNGMVVTYPIAGVGFVSPKTGIAQPGGAGDISEPPFGLGIDLIRTATAGAPFPTAFDLHGEDGRALVGENNGWTETLPKGFD
ncbi:MAG: hypothetical protein L6R28_20455 [Planctomycetes bacterium]|nr:hypothetical protein [Planctomycetota bacterium]